MRLVSCHVGGASFRCLILAALLLLHRCHMAGSLQQRSEGALTVVKNTEDGEEEATVDDVGDFEVVQPSERWQTLKPGQAVPAGSHVRLNMQTGEREVRLGEEQLKYWTQEHREKEDAGTSFSPDELKRAMRKIKEDLNLASKDTNHQVAAQHRRPVSMMLCTSTALPLDTMLQQTEGSVCTLLFLTTHPGAKPCGDVIAVFLQDSVASQYRPLEELKRDMAQLDLLVETDVQIMRRLLDQFNSSNTTTEQRLSILLELEYLVHQVDNAQTLCSMGGLQLILEGLNSSDIRLQESSAFVLGSALASNPAVQVRAVESGALQTLLTTLANVQPFMVKKKVLFAVASLLRHFPYAQRHFLSHGGLQILSELFRADGSGILRTRIVTMLYDMISEKELMSQAWAPVQDPSHEERLRQYSEVSLQGELLEKGWCSLVPQLLQSTEHDYREKALRALLVMASVCLDQYRLDSSLLDSLLALRLQYQEMAQSEMFLGEENSYFTEIVELIDELQVKLK